MLTLRPDPPTGPAPLQPRIAGGQAPSHRAPCQQAPCQQAPCQQALFNQTLLNQTLFDQSGGHGAMAFQIVQLQIR